MKHKINIDGAQNVEVSKPIPCEKSIEEQLNIMEAYTKAHKDSAGLDKAESSFFSHYDPSIVEMIAGLHQ